MVTFPRSSRMFEFPADQVAASSAWMISFSLNAAICPRAGDAPQNVMMAMNPQQTTPLTMEATPSIIALTGSFPIATIPSAVGGIIEVRPNASNNGDAAHFSSHGTPDAVLLTSRHFF